MSSDDTNIRISSKALHHLREIKGEILIRDHEEKSIKAIIEEIVEKCHSSIESSKVLKTSSLEQAET